MWELFCNREGDDVPVQLGVSFCERSEEGRDGLVKLLHCALRSWWRVAIVSRVTHTWRRGWGWGGCVCGEMGRKAKGIKFLFFTDWNVMILLGSALKPKLQNSKVRCLLTLYTDTFLAFWLRGPRGNDTLVTLSIPRAQILFSKYLYLAKRNKAPWGKEWLQRWVRECPKWPWDTFLCQKVRKWLMNDGICQKTWEATWKGSHWPNWQF